MSSQAEYPEETIPSEPDRLKAGGPCATALKLVYGDRNRHYGEPIDDFDCTAAYWTAWLRRRGLLLPGKALAAEDVGPMMILLKLSRQARGHHDDNLVDAAGYAETAYRVHRERERRCRAEEQNETG